MYIQILLLLLDDIIKQIQCYLLIISKLVTYVTF